MLNTYINMSVSAISIICHSKFTLLTMKHTKSSDTQVRKCPILEYFINPIRCVQIC